MRIALPRFTRPRHGDGDGDGPHVLYGLRRVKSVFEGLPLPDDVPGRGSKGVGFGNDAPDEIGKLDAPGGGQARTRAAWRP